MTRWAKCVAFMMEMRDYYKSFAGNLQVKSSVGKLGFRCEENIETNLRCEGGEWSELAQDVIL
jgi:hypothetical protein